MDREHAIRQDVERLRDRSRNFFGALQMLHVHLRPAWDGDWVTGFFTTPPIRRREIEAYWRALDPTLPTIVAGDFNEEVGPHGQALAYLHERALRRADTNGTPTWQWKGNVSGRPIHLRLTLDTPADHHPPLAATDAPA